MRTRGAIGCLAVIAGADYVIKRHPPPWLLSGPFDHAAHVATAALVLANLGHRPHEWRAGFMAGSLLPDVDHVPLALQPVHPGLDDPRPVTHSLAAVAPVAAAAVGMGSRALAGTAAGMLAHFARDLGVGTGAPLLWPATRWSVRVPYPVYLAGCLALARRATLQVGL